MRTGLSEILNHNEQSPLLLGVYVYQATDMTYPLLSQMTKFTLSECTTQSL